MKKVTAEIVIPKGADRGDLMVELTRQLSLKTGQSGGAGLGGENGYGIDFENDVFMMHPYCWCEKYDCPWCAESRENFLYKPTGFKMHWYKYIGRDEETDGKLPKDWFENCVRSIWGSKDCYVEFSMGARDISEGLMGRKEPAYVELCFNVRDKAIVKANLSPFADSSVINGWDLDMIISDIRNEMMDDNSAILKQIKKYDKKYPALREKIRVDAIAYHKDQIKWHKDRVKELEV
jgi:hypothetical protein